MSSEDNLYADFIYNLALKDGISPKDSQILSEIAVFQKRYVGIRYPELYEKKLSALMRKHHKPPHN
jgi:hypothetical protein